MLGVTALDIVQPGPSCALERDAGGEMPAAVPYDVDAALQRILDKLLARRPQADVDLVRRAFYHARQWHGPQQRWSGELYFTHPVQVTEILAELEMDEETLAAGLLHDVVEDCGVGIAELAREFGTDVASMVDGVTKLHLPGVDEVKKGGPSVEESGAGERLSAKRQRKREQEEYAANLRKIFVAMAGDLRVIVIKLADRLHNMRTLDALPPDRRQRIAVETLQIFAPLADRLGIWQMKWQLEDLAFKYAEPEPYARVAALVARNRAERQAEVDGAIGILKARLLDEGIEANVTGRPKHLYSIYNKMKEQGLEFTDLYDLTALRVIVHTRPECYNVLGVVSALWTPLRGMYSDYIARAKPNMYQSLHIKVLGPNGTPLEVQIRTWDMHRTAEFGIAAHWQYKSGGRPGDETERRLAFLRMQMEEWKASTSAGQEFVRTVTESLFPDQVYVLTPKGDIRVLPAGSGPIDFAYRIHSEVGDHLVSAYVNGRPVPLEYQLQNGDTVRIKTRPNAAPSRDWLALVRDPHARSKIKAYFKRANHAENVQKGRELLEKVMQQLVEREPRAWGDSPRELLKEDSLRLIAALFNMPSETELLAAVGYGTVAPLAVLNRLKPSTASSESEIQVSGGRANDRALQITAGGLDAENLLFRRSRCCLPIPGDDVIGYVTLGRGMALHRRDCPNARHYLELQPERCTPVEYVGREGQVFQVYLSILAWDRTGLLADVGITFAENKTNITFVKTITRPDRTATFEFGVEVRDTEHLTSLMQKLYAMGDIVDIKRTVGGREEPRTR